MSVHTSIDPHTTPAGGVTGDLLAADVLSPWRTLHQANGYVVAAVTAGDYYLNGSVSAVVGALGVPAFHVLSTDYAVVGRTTKLRLLASALVNAVAPTSTFAVKLVPITSPAGLVGALSVTAGASVATATFTAPAANSLTRAVSSTISLPSDGLYAVLVTTSVATTAIASLTQIAAHLQVSHA